MNTGQLVSLVCVSICTETRDLENHAKYVSFAALLMNCAPHLLSRAVRDICEFGVSTSHKVCTERVGKMYTRLVGVLLFLSFVEVCTL